jgi:hypothetical protein
MSNKPAEILFSDTSCLEEARPTARYLLNSTTRESYKYGPEGSLTFYVRRIRLAAPGNPIGCPRRTASSTASTASICPVKRF